MVEDDTAAAAAAAAVHRKMVGVGMGRPRRKWIPRRPYCKIIQDTASASLKIVTEEWIENSGKPFFSLLA